MTKYRATNVILSILIIGSLLFTISALLNATLEQQIISIVSTILLAAIMAAHARGWRRSGEATTLAVLILILASTDSTYVSQNLLVSLLIPAVIAAALLSPRWSLAVFGSGFLAVVLKTRLTTGSLTIEALGPTLHFENLVLLTMAALGIAAVSALARSAQGAAEENARQATVEKERAEQQARELAKANEQLNAQLLQQRELIDLVATLETPAVPLAQGVLLAPIVGHIDTRRAEALTSKLLEQANLQRTRLVVLDIAGVALIDTAVAKALLNTAQALRLLGCEVALSGISASVAMTLVHLGVAMEGITTVRSPQEALMEVYANPASGQ
jgi:rsbT co-antagonist protein RsbR